MKHNPKSLDCVRHSGQNASGTCQICKEFTDMVWWDQRKKWIEQELNK